MFRPGAAEWNQDPYSLAVRALLQFVVAALVLQGCAQIRVTDPPRTATEQFLISRAASQAVSQVSVAQLRDRAVFVDDAYFLPQGAQVAVGGNFELHYLDREFVVAELRSHLLLNGVRLVDVREGADIVLEMRTAGLGIDRQDFLLGLPPVLVPADSLEVTDSDEGSLVLPEIAFLKNIRQQGFASIAYVAYWRDTGEVVGSSGPFVGRTYRSDWWYFGFGPRTTGDIESVEGDLADPIEPGQ